VPLERTPRFVHAADRSICQRERVVRGAPLREERDGAFQMRDGRAVVASGFGDTSETELRRRLGRRLAPQRVEQRRRAIEAARIEQRSARYTLAGRYPATAATPPRT
jgi:hypothetical protein